MKQFEYRIERFYDTDNTQSQERINTLGGEGWELVNVADRTAYFKRVVEGNYITGSDKRGPGRPRVS